MTNTPITTLVKQRKSSRFPANQEVTKNADGTGGPVSIAKQTTKAYKKVSKKFPDFNKKTDTIMSSRGHFIEDNLQANTINAKNASSYLFNKNNKNSGNSKNIVKYVESEDDKSFMSSDGVVTTHSLYKKDKLKDAVTPLKKKDACYSKVKSRYKKWPSAYASGALVKCRKVGAANWGNKSKK